MRRTIPVLLILASWMVACGGGGSNPDAVDDEGTPGDTILADHAVPPDGESDGGDRDATVGLDVPDAVTQDLTGEVAADTAVEDSVDVTAADIPADFVQPPPLKALALQPDRVFVKAGDEAQVHVLGIYEDDTSDDLTADASFNIVDLWIASVSNDIGEKGLVTGLHEGVTTLFAQIGEVQGQIDIVVTPPDLEGLEIRPAERIIPKWSKLQLQAMAIYSDGSSVDVTWSCQWSSTDDGVVAFDWGTPGLAVGVEVGNVTVTAFESSLDLMSEGDMAVTEAELTGIAVNPAEAAMPLGSKRVFEARGSFVGGMTTPMTTGVVWTSSNEDTATVSNDVATFGLVTAVALGDATITATSGDFHGDSQVNVTAAALDSVRIIPESYVMRDNETYAFSAEAVYSDATVTNITEQAEWSALNATYVTVSNVAGQKGRVHAESIGQGAVRASFGGKSDDAWVTVKRMRGDECYGDDECLGGHCEKPSTYAPYGFCCDTECPDNNGCQHCAWGDCRPVEAGTDPVGQCDNYYCDGTGHCGSTCSDEGFNCSSKCKNAWCWAGQCLDRMGPGNSCVGNCQCNSNLCLFFFCT